MSIIGLVVVLILVGLCLWAINTAIPMEPNIKRIVTVLVVVVAVLYVLQALGLLDGLGMRIR